MHVQHGEKFVLVVIAFHLFLANEALVLIGFGLPTYVAFIAYSLQIAPTHALELSSGHWLSMAYPDTFPSERSIASCQSNGIPPLQPSNAFVYYPLLDNGS